MNKKGQAGISAGMQTLLVLVLGIVVVGMTAAFGSDVVQDTQSDFTVNSQAYNNTADALTGIGETTAKLDTLTTAVVGFLILSLIIGAVAFIRLR